MPEHAGRRLALVGLVALVSFIAFESIAVATAMPEVARELSIGVSYALAFSLFLTGSLSGQGAAGAWCDRTGPSPALLAGTAVFAAGLVASGLAPGAGLLLAGRAVSGVGAGLVMVALYVVVAEVFDPAHRPKVFGLLSAAWVVPSLAGPLVAGWLATHVTWRAVFLLVAPLALVAAGIVVPVLRRLPARHGRLSTDVRRRTLWSMVLAAGALLAPWGLRPGEDLWVRGVLVGGGLLLVGGSLPRLLPPGTLRGARGLPAVIGVRTVIAGAYFGSEAYLPLAMNTVRGMPLIDAGLALTGASIGWAVGSWLQSRDPALGADRVRWLLAGALFVTVGVATLPSTMLDAVTPWVVVLIWSCSAVGMGFAMSTSNVVVMALSEPEQTGRDGAALQVGEALGSITGVTLAGLLHNELSVRLPEQAAYAALWWVLAGCALVGVWLATRARPVRWT